MNSCCKDVFMLTYTTVVVSHGLCVVVDLHKFVLQNKVKVSYLIKSWHVANSGLLVY